MTAKLQLATSPHSVGTSDVVALLGHQVGLWSVLIVLATYTIPRLAPYLVQVWVLSSDRRTGRYVQIQPACPCSESLPADEDPGADDPVEEAEPTGPGHLRIVRRLTAHLPFRAEARTD